MGSYFSTEEQHINVDVGEKYVPMKLVEIKEDNIKNIRIERKLKKKKIK